LKNLLLIRHAKSSWDDPAQEDFERTLNERGKKDAPLMAKRLLERKIRIDAFISSPAKRAKKTAELFAEEYGSNKNKIILHSELYLAASPVFHEIISSLDEDIHHAAIFSHNPGITDFVNELTAVRVDNMPTCAVYAITVEIIHWKDFNKAKKNFLFFDYPKKRGV
jgi:phosphohistidine phosphatase